jgi:arginyl-tRNA synthetase
MQLFVKGEGHATPHDLAEDLTKKLQNDKELGKIVDKIAIAGPGFINFWLKKDVLIDNLREIVKKNGNFGKSDLMGGKKIMIEFAHPNTHKLFHIGHLRNIATGESLARILEYAGAKVIRVNYQGDVGLHIAKAMWAIDKLVIHQDVGKS